MRQSIFPHLESDIMILLRKISGFGLSVGYLAYIPDGIFPLDIVDVENEQASIYVEQGIRDALVLIEAINISVIEQKGFDVFCTRWDMPWICQKTYKETATDIVSEDNAFLQSSLVRFQHQQYLMEICHQEYMPNIQSSTQTRIFF
jgi:hypothetical protein